MNLVAWSGEEARIARCFCSGITFASFATWMFSSWRAVPGRRYACGLGSSNMQLAKREVEGLASRYSHRYTAPMTTPSCTSVCEDPKSRATTIAAKEEPQIWYLIQI